MTSENSSTLSLDNDAQSIHSLQAQLNVESTVRAASATPSITITHGYDNAGSKVGDFASGATIDDTTPALFGQTTPKGTVRIYVDNVSKGYATADASGNWTFTLPGLSNGLHTIRAELLNGFAKIATSENFIINVGVSAPIITAVLDDAGQVTGHLDQNDWTDDRRPELIGAAEPGHFVKIYDGTTLLGTTVANASGTWRFTPESDLGLGTHNLVAQAEDANGIVSGLSSPWTITVVSPVSISHGADNAGAIVGDFTSGATVDETRPMLYGQATPNASVKIYVDNIWMADVMTDASGNWSYRSSELSNGTHTIRAELINGSTLVSKSDDFVFNVAVASVQAPVITAVLDDVGAVTGHLEQNSSTDDARPELIGTAEPGHLVKIYDGETLLGSSVADASGIWRYTPKSDLSQGKHNFVAEALDPIGNISSKSNPWTITVSTSPVTITHGYDSTGGIIGNFASGATVDDTTPTLYGQTSPNGWVRIYMDNDWVGARTADASGNWSHTLSGLSNGPHTVWAELIDDNWCVIGRSESFVINVAVSHVQAPVITAVMDDAGAVTGHLEQNGRTDDVRPELSGTAEAGRLVKIYDGTTLLGSTLTDAAGIWRYTLESDLSPGKHTLAAEAQDGVGNLSGKSNTWTIAVETPPTSIVTITHAYDSTGDVIGNFASDATVDDTTPTLYGQTSPNGWVRIYMDNDWVGSRTADASGNWSHTLSGLSNGPHTIWAELIDDNWRVIGRSENFTINVVTAPVQAPVAIEHDVSDTTSAGTMDDSSVGLNTYSARNTPSLNESKTLALSIGDVLQQDDGSLFPAVGGVQTHGESTVLNLDEALSSSLGSNDQGDSGNARLADASHTHYQYSSLDMELLAQQGVIA